LDLRKWKDAESNMKICFKINVTLMPEIRVRPDFSPKSSRKKTIW
jgi:hypothetical protein